MRISRRTALSSLALPLAAPALGQPRRFIIMSHAVHRNVLTTGPGGDVTAEWRRRTGMEIEWLTFGVEAVHERLYREAQLTQGGVDACFMLERYGGPHVAPLFEDLATYQAAEPIERAEEISPSMVAAHTYRGRQVGVPFRHGTHGFFQNRALMRERGAEGVPESFEEIIALADRLSFVRADGSRVAG